MAVIKFEQAVESAHQLYSHMLEAKVSAEDACFILTPAIEIQLVMPTNTIELIQACSLM